MGLLDDAIRDHLELKRRHGGSSEEIALQEKEALGPVRRTVEGAEDDPELAGAEAPEEELGDLEPAGDAEDGDVPVAEDEPFADEPPPVPPSDQPAGPALADFGSDFEDSGADPARPIADVEQPTEEWGFEDEEARAVEAEPEEDPLEETPDFLQETPEHERLWFEQKPPKDFDFDE